MNNNYIIKTPMLTALKFICKVVKKAKEEESVDIELDDGIIEKKKKIENGYSFLMKKRDKEKKDKFQEEEEAKKRQREEETKSNTDDTNFGGILF